MIPVKMFSASQSYPSYQACEHQKHPVTLKTLNERCSKTFVVSPHKFYVTSLLLPSLTDLVINSKFNGKCCKYQWCLGALLYFSQK